MHWAITIRDRNWFPYKVHDSRRACARYAKHRNDVKRLVQNTEYKYDKTLAMCVKEQLKKYSAYVLSQGSLREGSDPLTAIRNSASVNDLSKAKAICNYWSNSDRKRFITNRGDIVCACSQLVVSRLSSVLKPFYRTWPNHHGCRAWPTLGWPLNLKNWHYLEMFDPFYLCAMVSTSRSTVHSCVWWGSHVL